MVIGPDLEKMDCMDFKKSISGLRLYASPCFGPARLRTKPRDKKHRGTCPIASAFKA